MNKHTKTPRWDMLQSAQFHLFDAAKYAVQAMALEGQGHHSRAYETLSREAFFQAANAFGYTVTPKPAPVVIDAEVAA